MSKDETKDFKDRKQCVKQMVRKFIIHLSEKNMGKIEKM